VVTDFNLPCVGSGGCCSTDQKRILEDLYNSTNGKDWTNSEHWCTDKPIAEWHGINMKGGDQIQSLDLQQNNLNGGSAKLQDLRNCIFTRV
jgi:hypothetical protein